MFKSKLLSFCLLCCLNFTAAANDIIVTCPTIEDIAHEKLDDWLPLYQEGEELVSSHDLQKFIANVAHFAVARWSGNYLESAHCFYQGSDSIVTQMILAQDAWQPVTNSYWSWVAPKKLAECRSANVGDCGFIK